MAKKIVLVPALALALAALGNTPRWCAADMQTTERITEKTTTYSGVVSSVDPSSSTIVVRSQQSSAPVTYSFNKQTTFVDASGHVISSETIKDSPVRVHYIDEGGHMVVTKVEVLRPGGASVRRETTTTTETR